MFLTVCKSAIAKNYECNSHIILTIALFIFVIRCTEPTNLPFLNNAIRQRVTSRPYSCLRPNKIVNCLGRSGIENLKSVSDNVNDFQQRYIQQFMSNLNSGFSIHPQFPLIQRPVYPHMNSLQNIHAYINGKYDNSNKISSDIPSYMPNRRMNELSPKVNTLNTSRILKVAEETVVTSNISTYPIVTKNEVGLNKEIMYRRSSPMVEFMQALDKMERKFYMATFEQLRSSGPKEHHENGISFVQSALFLNMFLLAVSTEVDEATRAEIDECIGLSITDTNKVGIIKEILSSLPKSSNDLVFRWSSRLAIGSDLNLSQEFLNGTASALQLRIWQFNGSETPAILAQVLNGVIEEDSKGALHNTFDEDDLSGSLSSVMLTMLYLRGRWRSAPTVLNGTRAFRDADNAGTAVRMIRINDIMRYADLTDCDAEAMEIFYATPGLSLIILLPRSRSLKNLANYVVYNGLDGVIRRMKTARIAVSMPLYTLRMTVLLPNKLQTMGISRLLNLNNVTNPKFRISHGVQRVMFWAEAGRNAFKDDGIEWDPSPELEITVDRPYMFFVRWHNTTLMNGNFVH